MECLFTCRVLQVAGFELYFRYFDFFVRRFFTVIAIAIDDAAGRQAIGQLFHGWFRQAFLRIGKSGTFS